MSTSRGSDSVVPVLRPREFIVPQKSQDNDNEIPTIPDMDEIADSLKDSGSISSKISVNQSVLYKELDSELIKQNSLVSLDGINLSPLFKFIHPDSGVKETDTVWTIDSLFKDLSEYYQNENIQQL